MLRIHAPRPWPERLRQGCQRPVRRANIPHGACPASARAGSHAPAKARCGDAPRERHTPKDGPAGQKGLRAAQKVPGIFFQAHRPPEPIPARPSAGIPQIAGARNAQRPLQPPAKRHQQCIQAPRTASHLPPARSTAPQPLPSTTRPTLRPRPCCAARGRTLQAHAAWVGSWHWGQTETTPQHTATPCPAGQGEGIRCTGSMASTGIQATMENAVRRIRCA